MGLPNDRPTRVRYGVMGFTCSVAVIVYIHRIGFSEALPRLNLDSEQAGWLQAAFLFAYAAFEVPMGLAADRLGTRRLLTLLVLGWSFLSGLVALAVGMTEPLLFLIAVRFLFGVLQAGAFPSTSRVVTDWAPPAQRGTFQGLVWMSTRAGGVIIPHLFFFLAVTLGFGFGGTVWALAALGLVWCVLFFPWFRDRPEQMPAVNEAEARLIAAGRPPEAGHSGVPWRRLLRSRSVWGLCLMYAGMAFGANFFIVLLPTYLQKHQHIPPEQSRWLCSLPFLFGVLACISGGRLSDWLIRRTGSRKWGRRSIGMVSLSLGALGWLGLAAAEGPVMIGVALCFVWLCNDMNMGPAWAACGDVGERYAGTVGGAMNMMGNLAGALGTVIAGRLLHQGQPGLLFTIFAGGFVVSVLAWLLVDATRPVTAPDAEPRSA